MDWKTISELVNILVWPVVVLAALLAFRKPLGTFLSGLSGRLTKLSVFDVSIEMAELPQPLLPWANPNFPQSSEMTGGEVGSTTLSTLFERLDEDKSWDYLIVDVKDGKFWFVSRLFVFTVFLQAMRDLKCVMFVQSSAEVHRRVLGLASPDVLRAELAQDFPWLERTLTKAIAQHEPKFLAPALPPIVAGEMIRSFIADRDMQIACDPTEMCKSPNNCKVPTNQVPTDPIQPGDWTSFKTQQGTIIWEHTPWLDLGIRPVGDAIGRSFCDWDLSHYVEKPGVSNEERIRALLSRKTPYIALVNSRFEFKALLDHQKLAVLVGEASIK